MRGAPRISEEFDAVVCPADVACAPLAVIELDQDECGFHAETLGRPCDRFFTDDHVAGHCWTALIARASSIRWFDRECVVV